MPATIEEKLAAIKDINASISQIELASVRHFASGDIDWTLVSKATKAKVDELISADYKGQKQELIRKAEELMK